MLDTPQPSFREPGRHQVRIAGSEMGFEVPPHKTILQGALHAGLDWPNGCRVGICGTCRCKVIKGQVEPLTDSWRGLDQAHLGEGYVLACRSLLHGDIVVSAEHLTVNDATESERNRPAIVTRTRRLTPTILELNLQMETTFRTGYLAGQYTRLSVPDQAPTRCFSFASACRGDGRLTFHIRLFPGGFMSEWLTANRVGSEMIVDKPMGEFTLRDSERPLLMIAGGTGLAPLVAMLEELSSQALRQRPVRVIYAARDQAHLYDRGRIAAIQLAWPNNLRFDFLPVLSREPRNSGWRGYRGHVFDHLSALVEGFEDAEAFVCGPPGLVDAVQLYLCKAGWRLADIHADRFLPAF